MKTETKKSSNNGLLMAGLLGVVGYFLIKSSSPGGSTTGIIHLTIAEANTIVKIGTTVLNVGNNTIKAGTYTWTATCSGYVSKSGSITVPAGETVNLNIDLSQVVNGGTLRVNYSPSNATVRVNGSGVSDGESITLAAGTYNWNASALGYTSQTGTVTIQNDHITTLSISLVGSGGDPGTGGTLTVTIDPVYAIAKVNGSTVTNGESYELAPGTYNWTASAEGFDTKNGSVTIKLNQITVLNIKLTVTGGGDPGEPTPTITVLNSPRAGGFLNIRANGYTPVSILTATIYGVTGEWKFLSNANGDATKDIPMPSNITAGTHSLSIKDSQGYSAVTSFTVLSSTVGAVNVKIKNYNQVLPGTKSWAMQYYDPLQGKWIDCGWKLPTEPMYLNYINPGGYVAVLLFDGTTATDWKYSNTFSPKNNSVWVFDCLTGGIEFTYAGG